MKTEMSQSIYRMTRRQRRNVLLLWSSWSCDWNVVNPKSDFNFEVTHFVRNTQRQSFLWYSSPICPTRLNRWKGCSPICPTRLSRWKGCTVFSGLQDFYLLIGSFVDGLAHLLMAEFSSLTLSSRLSRWKGCIFRTKDFHLLIGSFVDGWIFQLNIVSVIDFPEFKLQPMDGNFWICSTVVSTAENRSNVGRSVLRSRTKLFRLSRPSRKSDGKHG